jgi:hypothetical protein
MMKFSAISHEDEDRDGLQNVGFLTTQPFDPAGNRLSKLHHTQSLGKQQISLTLGSQIYTKFTCTILPLTVGDFVCCNSPILTLPSALNIKNLILLSLIHCQQKHKITVTITQTDSVYQHNCNWCTPHSQKPLNFEQDGWVWQRANTVTRRFNYSDHHEKIL